MQASGAPKLTWNPNPLARSLGLCGLLLLLQTTSIIRSLRIDSIEVPSAVANGTQIMLVCNYDLQNDQLYSVKWYKNYVEFFRFQFQTLDAGSESQLTQGGSSNKPQLSKHEFELDGISLNLSKSNSTHVLLKQISLSSEGNYKCEVSADSPSFATVSLERRMKVYVLPKQKLTIFDNSVSSNGASSASFTNVQGQNQSALANGEQPVVSPLMTTKGPIKLVSYPRNELANLTCVSSPSSPAAQLTWLINDQQISSLDKNLLRWFSIQQHYQPQNSNHMSKELIETRSTLTFRLDSDMINWIAKNQSTSPMAFAHLFRLRCVAKLSASFQTETTMLLSGGHKTVRNRHPTSASRNQNDSYHASPLSVAGSDDSASSGLTKMPSNSVDIPVNRWPSMNSRTVQRAQSWTDQTDSSADWPVHFQQQQQQQQQQQHRSELATRRLGQQLWTGAQLSAQAEKIRAIMEVSRPNELETPNLEAKTGETDINTDIELIEVTCSPRGRVVERNPIGVRTKWLINGREINSSRVNDFDGIEYGYKTDPRIEERSAQLNWNKQVWTTKKHSSSSSHNVVESSIPNSDDDELDSNGPSVDNDDNSLQSDPKLFIELTNSLMQLKELNVKCQTSVNQPMIEYEDQIIIANPYRTQQRQKTTPYPRGYQLRDRAPEIQSPSMTNGVVTHRQAQNRRKTVIGNRLDSESSSSDALSSRLDLIDRIFGPRLIVLLTILAISLQCLYY